MENGLVGFFNVFNKRFFEVPDYQRGYAWGDLQVKDLIKDIERISGRKHNHYTGTIVITPKTKESNTYEIVDGQQRLTTLVIFLKSIYETDEKKYFWIKNKFLIKGGLGNERQLLRLNQDYNNFFNEFILKGNNNISPQNKYEENIKNTKLLFDEYLLNNKIEPKIILKTICQRLGFLIFEPKNDSEIGIMFEVINNRGKELSELEKIKNYFIYYATVLNKDSLRLAINQKWKLIIDFLSEAEQTSVEDENAFLRNCYLVFFEPNKAKSWNVYKEIKIRFDINDKKEINKKIATIENFIDYLEKSALGYAYFFNDNFFTNHYKGKGKIELSRILKILRCHPVNASIMPLYLSFNEELKNDANEIRIIELLNLLEILNFRIYVLPKVTNRADSKQGDLFTWANDFYNKKDWTSTSDPEKYYSKYNRKPIQGDILDWIKTELIEFTKAYCPELKIVQSLTLDSDEIDDFMDWNGLRFFLASYEEMLQNNAGHSWNIENIKKSAQQTKANPNDYLSREHIWARKNIVEKFDENNLQKRRLGNFVFLGLKKNKEFGALSIKEKVKLLTNINDSNKGEAHLYQTAHLKDILTSAQQILKKTYSRETKYYFEDLSKLISDKRETDLIKFALNRWKFSNEIFNQFKEVNSFIDKKVKHNYILS
jgi:hypothetical protein